jgi:arabinogalactan endo-1,4-beta-galactosidase
MHTDEFEISLFRELKVCGNTILRIKKTLTLMEQKHTKTTEVFIEEFRNGKLDSDVINRDDYLAWENTYESLKQWQDLERQYQEQFRIMKISKITSAPEKQGGTKAPEIK